MMETDRRFLILCAGEVLIVVSATSQQRSSSRSSSRPSTSMTGEATRSSSWLWVLYAAVIAISGHILLLLLALAAALGCGYLALSLQDYRLSLRAGGGA